jgi:ubiquinone/menaquinone biosynthesis C-methylase UbiE
MSGDERQAVADLFTRSSEETYDAVGVDFFPVFAKNLLADVGLTPGSRVLDVGCGRGAVLFPAAEQVGAQGFVTGIDLSAGMIERTSADIGQRGLTNVSVVVMDAQQPTLPNGSFDAVLASCVVFFLPDPAAGLRAWHDLLVPAGRLGVTTFGAGDRKWKAVRDLFMPFVPQEMGWVMATRSALFTSSENFEKLLASAGFVDIASTVRVHDVVFTDAEHWLRWSLSHGQRMFWELIPADRLVDVRAQALSLVESLRDGDGRLTLAETVRYSVARRPGE